MFFFSFFLVTPKYWCCVVGVACLVIGGYLLVFFFSFLGHLGYLFNSNTRACLLFFSILCKWNVHSVSWPNHGSNH